MSAEATGMPDPVREFHDDVCRGLGKRPRCIPPKYFYDARGSELFDRICELPEYYLTRTELAIMREHAAGMADAVGPDALVLEPGSGSSVKIRLLLDELINPVAYAPVEICAEHLAASCELLRDAYPALPILPVCADFTREISVPDTVRTPRRRLIYFPGSTLGNFAPADAENLLRALHATAGPDGMLLLGIDLRKDSDVILPAYDDSAGVTAAFNQNLLRRINHELGADFVIDQFHHRAVWNDVESRIEMHLVSQRDQSVRIGEAEFGFSTDEPIITEYSYKYTVERLQGIAAAAGFQQVTSWQDPDNWFSVQLLHRH
ncbi:dimethylhistidine N-methyltransferase [Natronocella acetinitrilica]|uniref:Dimethylhistidine N-methyltransferase n=1 Tax=Natronocella acetinitrilica TaxID=414046 RepID=A0AAE3K9T4_9GAMM|nr:L-histidine N(alpha)-methyltransferase [Natronocella acetinitrilica]MCP1673085.1 dimethylhistidine N-methyltransferase [Natronocella acetinitrilica]